MSERVACPVKAETIGNANYLKWVQFCERSCPCQRNEELCGHPDKGLRFPHNSKEPLVSKVDEVKAAWKTYMDFGSTSDPLRYVK